MKGMHGRILRLALPSILANITVPLVGMADTAIAGHLGHASFIGGVAVGTMLFDLLYWNFGFLRVGTGGLAAQAYGRKDMREAAMIFQRGFITSMLCALAVWVLQWFVVQGAFLVIDCTPQVKELAQTYFNIRIWAAPATLSMFVFKGWFIGMQDTVRPMAIDVFVNIVNIVASLFFALRTPLGFAGVAWGTLLAQYSGLLLSFILLFAKYRNIFKGADVRVSMRGGRLASFFKMNGNLFLRSVCMILIYIGFTTISAHFGDELLAVSSILMKLLMIFSFFIDGFAYAGEALSGRYVGERQRGLFNDAVGKIFIWGAGISVLFLFVYGFAGRFLLGIMTDDNTVIELSLGYMPWLMLMPLLGGAAFIWDGVFVGATETKTIRNSMIFAAAGFFLFYYAGIALAGIPASGLMEDAVSVASDGTVSVAGKASLGIHILCGAYFAHLVIRSLYMTLRYGPLVRRKFSSVPV